MFILECLEHIF